MRQSENLAGWLLLSCLSLFIAVMIVTGCVLGIYAAEARHCEQGTGQRSTIFDDIWTDFGPRKQVVKRTRPIPKTTLSNTAKTPNVN